MTEEPVSPRPSATPLTEISPSVSRGENITIGDFSKIEMRVGVVEEATNKDGSDKLIRLVVDFAEFKRIIFTAVRPYGYTPEFFLGKKFLFLTNLEYKKIMDEESQGMIIATDGPEGPIFLDPGENSVVGAKIR